MKELRQLTPQIPIVSEEAVGKGISPDIQKGNFWLEILKRE